MTARAGRDRKRVSTRRNQTTRRSKTPTSAEAIRAAEEVALAAFASGLKLAAAFGTVAARTTSLALSSLATGADKFSELVKKESLDSSKVGSSTGGQSQTRSRRRKIRKAG